jgi:hypothetical protein
LHAWASTPAVENFRRFAEPASPRFEGKASYLFSPVVFEFVGLLAMLGLCLPKRVRNRVRLDDRLRRRAYLWSFSLLFLFGLWGTHHNASRALRAAADALALPTSGKGPGTAVRPLLD